MNIEEIIELAKEVEMEDPIDWGYLNISEDDAYRLMASSIYEMFENFLDEEDSYKIMLATITKLVVENFVLNMKMIMLEQNKEIPYGKTET